MEPPWTTALSIGQCAPGSEALMEHRASGGNTAAQWNSDVTRQALMDRRGS
jgi:hypothetical protein